MFFMYFSEIYTTFILDSFFHFLYLFKMWNIFMPHPVYYSYSITWLKKTKGNVGRCVCHLSQVSIFGTSEYKAGLTNIREQHLLRRDQISNT